MSYDMVIDLIDSESENEKAEQTKIVFKSKFKKYFECKLKNNEQVAECLLCLKNNKKNVEIKMKNRNTSGLKKHLQSKHLNEFKFIFPTTSQEGTKKTFVKAARKVEENSDFIHATIDWICKTYQPLSFFDNDATKSYFKLIAPKVEFPSKNDLKINIKLRFEDLQSKLKANLLNNKSKISFTIDGCTSIANRTYYGITAHYIDNDWNYQSTLLDFVPYHGKHSGSEIATAFKDCIEIFALNEKIQSITVDNITANTKCINELSKLLPQFNAVDQNFLCMAHILNFGVQTFMSEVILHNGTDNEVENESEDEEDEECTNKAVIDDNSNSIMKIRSIFSKISCNVMLYYKLRSTCETAELDSFVKPILDCSNKWNSTYDMLGVALRMKNGINTVCNTVEELMNFGLTEEEWEIIENMHKLLTNFKTVSTKLGEEKYITLPHVIPAVNLLIDKIENKITQLIHGENYVDNILANALQMARDKMLKHYEKTNWIYCVCLILDPRHKLELFDMTTWGREMKQNACEKFKSIYESYSEDSADTANSPPATISRIIEEEDEIDIEQLYAQPSTLVWIGDQTDQLNMYLSEKRAGYIIHILDWWKRHGSTFPQLARMARDFLAIPATSVPAERVFSRASLTRHKHPNSLSNETARWLLCINNWAKE